MRLNDTKWFKLGKEYLREIGQNIDSNYTYIKINVINVKALALSEVNTVIE